MKRESAPRHPSITRRLRIPAAALALAALALADPGLAASPKSFAGAVHEIGPGRPDRVTEFLYELTEGMEARITICAVFESTRRRSRGTLEGLIWVLRPDQTGEQCSIAGQPVVDGKALVCCRTGSPDGYPAGTVVAGELRKIGVHRLRSGGSAATHVEVFDGRLEAGAGATARVAGSTPALGEALTAPTAARPLSAAFD